MLRVPKTSETGEIADATVPARASEKNRQRGPICTNPFNLLLLVLVLFVFATGLCGGFGLQGFGPCRFLSRSGRVPPNKQDAEARISEVTSKQYASEKLKTLPREPPETPQRRKTVPITSIPRTTVTTKATTTTTTTTATTTTTTTTTTPSTVSHGRWWRATVAETTASDKLALSRRKAVLAAFFHTWGPYKSRAFGMDETKPTSGVGVNRYGGIGMTLLDSLDSLFLMGMEAEFDNAVS